ncbi:MAG: MBL fold metallo-hydrolase [Actinomycetota bacterium]|nr:MBL fold metallo-hydrolase [Actinomycetota bacterium]
MRVWVCGVRGSTPAPGAEFTRHGGHTSCLAIGHDGEPPSLIVDAGTGIRRVTGFLEGAPFRGTILLGHLHWDHTQGLPFFAAADRPDARTDVLLPDQGDAAAVLERAISPPHFPIGLGGLRGTWRFGGLEPGRHRVEGFNVLALDIPHKGGRTFGYRISDDGEDGAALAYLSDHNPIALGGGPDGLGPYHEAAVALAGGVDVLFHDAQHTAAELPSRASFGHSAADYAVGLGVFAGAATVLLYHHDPSRTDAEVDAMVASLQRPGIGVCSAVEQAVLDIGTGRTDPN